jgi:hypothetical protein
MSTDSVWVSLWLFRPYGAHWFFGHFYKYSAPNGANNIQREALQSLKSHRNAIFIDME